MRSIHPKRNDDAVAGVVGFVLILAAAVTYYSYAAQNEVPRVGAEAERAWDAEVGVGLERLAHAAGERVGTDAAVREMLPAAPEAPTQQIPLLAPLRSARASGSVEFSSDCGGATLSHSAAGSIVMDLVGGARGCVTFRGDTIYAEPFTYKVELGGVLRVQGDDAVVLTGPPLEADGTHVSITMVDLRGGAQSLGIDRASAPLSLSPRPASPEVSSVANAQTISWYLTTDHPEAWRAWYEERLDAAGVAATTSFSCATPGATGPARGPCTVIVAIPGSTSLAVTYGGYDVTLG